MELPPSGRASGSYVSAARNSASHGLNFIWVDTCCIDKPSSAELQEAINSMFRYYQESTSVLRLLI